MLRGGGCTIGLLVVLGLGLAGCGGGHGDSATALETALLEKNVGTLFSPSGLAGVKSPSCTASTLLKGDFSCTAVPVYRPCASVNASSPCASPLAARRVWLSCYPSKVPSLTWGCVLAPPPVGTPVFTTPAQRAAPKHGVWQCKRANVAQVKIGPFLLETNDPHGPREQEGGYMTRAAAKALAAMLHVTLAIDC